MDLLIANSILPERIVTPIITSQARCLHPPFIRYIHTVCPTAKSLLTHCRSSFSSSLVFFVFLRQFSVMIIFASARLTLLCFITSKFDISTEDHETQQHIECVFCTYIQLAFCFPERADLTKAHQGSRFRYQVLDIATSPRIMESRDLDL